MKNYSLDSLYAQLDKHIKLVQAYTEIEGIEFVIKACRLKPYDYIFKSKEKKIILYRHWIDEFGNSLLIKKGKKIRIIYNHLKLNTQKIICTDLYFGLSLDKVAKISKLMHLIAGKDDDLYQDCYLLSFLGIDNYLRSYLYLYNEWKTVSPLLMGMESLELLADHLDIKYFNQIGNKENSGLPCLSSETWLSFLPPSNGFLDLVKEKYELLHPMLEQI